MTLSTPLRWGGEDRRVGFVGDGIVGSCFAERDEAVIDDRNGPCASEDAAPSALRADRGRTFAPFFFGDTRSDLYSSLFRFFPRFSIGSVRNAASSVHSRRGSPNASTAPDEVAAWSMSPVRSIVSMSRSSKKGESRSDSCLAR